MPPVERSTASDDVSSSRHLVGRELGRCTILCELGSEAPTHRYAVRVSDRDGCAKLLAMERVDLAFANDPARCARFVVCARRAQHVRHPYVLSPIDIDGLTALPPYVLTEYVEGDHLGRVLFAVARKGKRVPERLVARILLDALAGLSAIHATADPLGPSLVHRALAPHALWIGTDGNVRIAGLYALAPSTAGGDARAEPFEARLAYLAPEQLDAAVADVRTDLFAMGVVLWEALTARRLFRSGNEASTRARIRDARIPPPSDVDPSLAPWDPLLARALAREPARRFGSADAFAAAVDAVARANDGIASPRSLGLFVREVLYDTIEASHRAVADAFAQRDPPRSGTHPRPSLADALTPVRATPARDDGRASIPPSEQRAPVPRRRDSASPSIPDVMPWRPTDPDVVATAASLASVLGERGSGEHRRVVVVRRVAWRTKLVLATAIVLLAFFVGVLASHAGRG